MNIFQNIYIKFTEQRKQVLLFLICGGTAVATNIISRYIFFFFFNYTISIILAYFTGMIIAFTLYKFTVFEIKEKDSLLREIVSFTLVNMLGMLQTLIISKILAEVLFPYIDFTFYPHDIAHILGSIIPVITSYFLHKHVTFARKNT